ncbi:MAG: hypothetical protein MUO61_02490 [Dehalococcoidia bacterium]|jgi:hypothetical protein|nr:hypothetical protein [Dehalococcoidia bacterium]
MSFIALSGKILLIKKGGVNSDMMEIQSVYFLESGSANTERTFEVSKRRAEELGIKTIVVASTSGETGLKAVKTFANYKVVVVTHTTGLQAPDVQELTPQNRAKILEKGGLILTATHAFGGVGRAVRRKLNTSQVDEIIAHTLRVFGQGTKVACEIALMAADAGLIRTDEEVISIGGTARGADTALVVKPAHTHDFFELKVKEVLCKPR